MRYLIMLVIVSMLGVTANAGESTLVGDCSSGRCNISSSKARPVINVVKAPVSAVINVVKVPASVALNVVKAPIIAVDRIIDRPREHVREVSSNSHCGCGCERSTVVSSLSENSCQTSSSGSCRSRRVFSNMRRCK